MNSQEPAAAAARCPNRRELSLDEYYVGVCSRDLRVFPRALSLIESTHPSHQRLAEDLLARLMPHTGRAMRVGISGVPGAGKSTFIETLGLYLIDQARQVAVLTIDPSSTRSGGSILGDKTRMAGLSSQPGAFIRPSPSGGSLGGVARTTRQSLLLCEAAGFDVVLIETVGVGQSETMVADMTDCFVALLLPDAGDELQGIKRGLIELVDVLVVNKADGATRTAAELAARQYAVALHALMGRGEGEEPVALTCTALQRESVAAVWKIIQQQLERRQASGQLAARRQRQNLRWLWATVDEHLRQAIRRHPALQARREELEQAVLAGTTPPEAAARQILSILGIEA